MAVVAKISAKSGKSVRTVVLRKGVNVLAADADAVVSLIDEATGRPIDGAQLIRHGSEISVSVPDSFFAASSGAPEGAPAGGTSEATPAETAGAGASSGGGSGLVYGLLGAAALGGLAAAAGGGGGGSKTPADTSPPAAPTGLVLTAADDTGSSNSDRITNQTSGLTITGTAEANATVTIVEGGTTLGTGAANASGAFSIDIALAAGAHNITATAKDAAGNTSAASTALAITVDTTSPAAPAALALAAADDTGASTADGITSQASALTITGTAEANSTVTLRDGATVLGTTTAGAGGVFSFDAALAAGAHNVTATATDAAGNVSTASTALAITVDTTAPTVAITSSLAALVLGQTATLTFTFSEAPAGFVASDIAVIGGTVTGLAVSPNNPSVYTATLTPTAVVPGAIAVSIAGGAFTDAAGNVGGAGSLNLTYDPGANGQAIDGYIANALVFRDADNDGTWDHETFTDANNNGLFDAGEAYVDADGNGAFTAEAAVKTDGEGNFTGLLGTGRIVLTPLIAGNGTNLTTDISTGQAFTGKLAAPDGSTVVTPLTTLVEAVAGAGATPAQVAAAQTQVKAALGLNASVDLTTLDPIAAVASGNAGAVADAIAVQKAATQVANILAVIGSASEAAGAAGGKDAGAAAATSALAAQITAGGTLDLASAAVIEQVAQSVATSTGGAAGADIAAQATALGSSLASVNTVIAQATGDSAAGTLATIVAAQIVAQENLASDVSAAIANNTVVDSSAYQGAALADKVDQAATEVEVVIPAEPAPVGAPGAPERPLIDDGARVSASEAADGVTVTVAYGSAANIAAGDTLRLLIGDTVVKSVVLTAGDIAAGSSTIALSAADLGADGAKSITAGFVSAAGLAGNVSLAAIVTLDTGPPAAPSGLKLAAADDTGVSSTDGVTSLANSLTISGTAEADSTVTLRDGATVLGTATANANGVFSLDVALAAGAHSITATSTDAAGNASPASAALAIAVDTTAPTAPTGLIPIEGGLLTTVEAANGTIIAGSTEAGTSVSITLTNGVNTLTKQAEVTGTAFSLALTAAEITALGLGAVHYTAVATDAAGNTGPVSSSGQYTYTNQPVAAGDVRVDDAATPVISEDDGKSLGVVPLKDGGFAVYWVVDADRNENGDAIAVQRFAADGNKTGGISLLQGIDANLIEGAGDDGTFALTALDNGGYALTYSLGLEGQGGNVTLPFNNPSTVIVGRPSEIFASSVPPGVTFTLSGLGTNGVQKTVPITLTNGFIEFDQAFLSQFSPDTRFSLLAVGIPVNQSASVFISTRLDGSYDRDGATTEVASAWTVQANAVGVIFAQGDDNPEAFRIDTRAVAPTFVILSINPPPGIAATLTLPANATLTPNGGIQLFNPTPDANGFYRIPESLLAQLEGSDYAANLIVGGQPAGSTVTGTAIVRESATNPEGVFVQLFGADGASLGGAGTRLDGGTAPFVGNNDDEGLVHVTALAGGGFAVNWVIDADGNGDSDGLAIQRFDGNGAKLGDVVVLQGLDPDLLENVDEVGSFDFQALEGGGYALAYSLALETTGMGLLLQGPSANAAIAGRLTFINVQGAPANAVVTLSGIGVDGLPKSIVLGTGSGSYDLDASVLNQFGIDNRFSITIAGMGPQQSATVSVGVAQDVHYDRSVPLETIATSFAVLAGNGLGVISTPLAHAESFHVDPLPGTPTFVGMNITPTPGVFVTLPAGAVRLANGTIAINNPTPDANGNYAIPESILNQLVGHDYQANMVFLGLPAGSTVTGSVTGREQVAFDEGVFVQTFGPDGVALSDAGARIDGAGAPVIGDFENGNLVKVTPLPGGGFAVSWLVDVNRDIEVDGVAVQRFGADGSSQGEAVVLQGLTDGLLETVDEVGSADIQALANGGYALAYSLVQEMSFVQGTVSFNANQPNQTISFVGKVQEIVVNGPANATYALQALNAAGVLTTVPVTVVDGRIAITQAILDQLPVDNRMSLVIFNLVAGNSVSAFANVRHDVAYDPDAGLVDVSITREVSNGIGALVMGVGRAEAFHIDSVSYANGVGPAFVLMTITPSTGGGSINIGGISGATLMSNGTIQIFNPVKDAAGDYVVPAQILGQLGDGDAQVALILGGLSGSSISGTIGFHEPIAVTEGVFVQTFGPDGALLSEGLDLTGTANGEVLAGDHGNDLLHGLGGNDILIGGGGGDVLDGGAGQDTLTGGAGADLFVLDVPGGQTLSVADLVTDFQSGTDHVRLPGAVTFADVSIVQGDPGTNGGPLTDSLIIHTASGDILARMANIDAATITQASFM